MGKWVERAMRDVAAKQRDIYIYGIGEQGEEEEDETCSQL